MWFRGRQPETSVWRRFRSAADGFVFTKEDDYYSAHVVANAERVVDLFFALTRAAPAGRRPRDRRRAREAEVEGRAAPAPRRARGARAHQDAARVRRRCRGLGVHERGPAHAQSDLELFIYARTDRWLYLLEGKGLEERRLVRTKSWKVSRQEFPPAPELTFALDSLVDSLKLTPA